MKFYLLAVLSATLLSGCGPKMYSMDGWKHLDEAFAKSDSDNQSSNFFKSENDAIDTMTRPVTIPTPAPQNCYSYRTASGYQTTCY